MSAKVVARFLDGRLLKGTTLDVDPKKPTCHVRPDGGKPTPVELRDLKALFFVRSYDGNSAHDEQLEPEPDDIRARGSVLVSLRFDDGEEIVGMTFRYPPNQPFFFVVPVDPKSNNVRVLINAAAVTSMKRVDGEE
jgi:hypothetical protein